MSRLAEIRAASTWSDIVEGQPQHLGIALLLIVGACSLLEPSADKLLGLSAVGWAQWSIALALIHQIMVAKVFRLQLHRNMMTRLFGKNDMKIWGAMFMPLLAVRPLTLIMVGAADTVPIWQNPLPLTIAGWALVVPAAWALYSTFVFFTIPRALGGDHFRDEIAEMPLVNSGAFKYTSNAMYGVAFLGLWAIALIFNSWNALIVALFQHTYIWVHMYCTEQPDMRRIYG
ncbi:MAG: methyltransferase [Paracoccaceae bacterium]|jgi:hypothetical protein|nr:methyltransferase [Paracoccaceae bacterium]